MLQPERPAERRHEGVQRQERDKCTHWRDKSYQFIPESHEACVCTGPVSNKPGSIPMSEVDEKIGQASAVNGEELTKLLEIELIQKRTEWKRATERNKNLKSLSLLFVFVIVMGSLAGFYFTYLRVQEGKQNKPAAGETRSGR
jgi:hypothetical protein